MGATFSLLIMATCIAMIMRDAAGHWPGRQGAWGRDNTSRARADPDADRSDLASVGAIDLTNVSTALDAQLAHASGHNLGPTSTAGEVLELSAPEITAVTSAGGTARHLSARALPPPTATSGAL